MSGTRHGLTQKCVDSVAPEGKRMIVRDAEIAAFVLCVLPTGAGERLITLRKAGSLRCDAARRKVRDFRHEARIGLDPEAERRRDEIAIMKISVLIETWAGKTRRSIAASAHRERQKRCKDDIRLLSLSGARRGEIFELKWPEIDFECGSLRLEATNSGKSIRPGRVSRQRSTPSISAD